MSNFRKLVEARMAEMNENWQTAERAIRAQVVAPVAAAPHPDLGQIYCLGHIYEGAQKLFDRPRDVPRFTAEVGSYKSVGGEVGPNGEIAMAPRDSITFVAQSGARWHFEGAVAFIIGELYDGDQPVSAGLLDTERGRKHLDEIIVRHIRSERPWFAERLMTLQVKSGYQRENLVVMVSLGMMDPIDALIAELRPFHVSSIRVGRMPAVGRTIEQARDLADHPKYFADTAFVKRAIKHEQLLALVERGATEDGGIQKIRVFKPEQGTTFSVPCADCDRWIWCGFDDYAGACTCGQKYEITFDGEPDWKLSQGWLCMGCGEPNEMALAGGPRNPWHDINGHQKACDVCFGMSHVGAWWVQKRADERRRQGTPA